MFDLVRRYYMRLGMTIIPELAGLPESILTLTEKNRVDRVRVRFFSAYKIRRQDGFNNHDTVVMFIYISTHR